MARFTTSTTPADPVRPYLQGVAKSLVGRLFGDQGPEWGTKLSEIEDTISAVRLLLCEAMLDEALQRQADTAGQRPADYQSCPKCGAEVEDKHKPDQAPRILQTQMGEAQWREPHTYCRKCRRSFFPSEQELGH